MNRPTAILLTAMAVTLMATFLGAVSLALFTEVVANPTNEFTTGTVDLSTTPESAFIYYTDMAPGDKVTAPLTVSNDGSLEVRYAVSSLAEETDGKGLREQLDLTIKSGVTNCTNAGFDTDGTVLYGPDDLGTDPEADIIGDSAPGFQAGDRTLAPSASEILCFQVELPLASGNAYQGAATTAHFGFYAEQTKNN
jgi:spore coat-associated protein N